MALTIDAERAWSLGIGSPYATPAELYIPDPTNASRLVLDRARATLPLRNYTHALVNMKVFQDHHGIGCSGWGFDMELLPSLLPALLWAVGFIVFRYLCREPLGRFGMWAGVVVENEQMHAKRLAAGLRGTASLSPKNRRKIIKFQNQLWLGIFYLFFSAVGYFVQADKPWFTLPLNEDSALHLLVPHPYNPPKEILFYYHYGLGFYFAELISLIYIESQVKRSDYMEYAFHHVTTLALIVFSHLGLEHRFGAYVLFIHDASDIMLAVGKVLHYIQTGNQLRKERYNSKHARIGDGKTYRESFFFKYILTEMFLNVWFAGFIAGFFFFRIYCLPMMLTATFQMASVVRHGNFNMWLLVVLLNVALQALHVYWATLIVLMVVDLLNGGDRKDIRSDDGDDESSVASQDATSLSSESEREKVPKTAIVDAQEAKGDDDAIFARDPNASSGSSSEDGKRSAGATRRSANANKKK